MQAMLIAGAITLPMKGHAEADTTQIKPVTVTSTKTERQLKDVPVRTEVITQEDIEKMHANNLAEVLRYTPGIQLEPNLKNGENVWMQGFDSDRVLILIDGNPVAPSLGASVDVTQIAVGDIERVEILKGSTSALYGTSAMGGVINVITSNPAPGNRASIEVSGGSWGEQNLDDGPLGKSYGKVLLSTQKKRWGAQVIAEITDSGGYTTDKDSRQTEGWEGQKKNLSTKFNTTFDNGLTLTLMPRLYQEDVHNIINNYGNLAQKRDQTDLKQVSMVLESPFFGDHGWKIRAMLDDYQNTSYSDTLNTTVLERERQTNTQRKEIGLQYDWLAHADHLITVGLDLKQDWMNVENISDETTRTTEVDDETYTSKEVFIQDSWMINNHLELLPGVRVNHDSDFGSHVSPMINGIYQIKDKVPGQINIRAGFGKGYRAPTLKERFYVFDQTFYKVLGNEDLDPETSTSYQLGAEWLLPENGRLGANLFYTRAQDFIQSEVDPSTVNMPFYMGDYVYKNVSEVSTKGLEFNFNRALTPSLKTNAAYTYMEAKDEDTDKYLTLRPKHQANLGVDWFMTADTSLALKMNFESKQYADAANEQESPSFFSWDLAFNQDLTDDWSWYAGIDNLSDEQRDFADSTDQRPLEGRYVYAGIKWDWKE
ncbi:hypothetical protein AVO41_09350 [Thiomicrospira sp. WB1]|nr:hypothetical protein AVO41_09350 [Thiomicrospira sp. WB1]